MKSLLKQKARDAIPGYAPAAELEGGETSGFPADAGGERSAPGLTYML